MDNVGFIIAGYLATFIIVGGYTVALVLRLRRARGGKS